MPARAAIDSGLILAIKTHYQIQDHESGPWSRDRVKRLAEMLSLSEGELAALIRLRPGFLIKYSEAPATMPGAVKLLLDLVERSAFSKYLGKEYPTSLFPDL